MISEESLQQLQHFINKNKNQNDREFSQKRFFSGTQKSIRVVTQRSSHAAFHSLNHHNKFEWPGQDGMTQQLRRKRMKNQKEHEYVKRMYEMTMEQKLKMVYKNNKSVDTFRAIPNEITAKKDQQALAQQVQQYQNAKQTNKNPEREEPQQEMNSPLKSQHHSAMQLHNKSHLKQRYYAPQHQNHMEMNNSRVSYSMDQSQSSPGSRRPSPEEYNQIYRLPYLSKNIYGPTSIPNYRKYANLSNSKDISLDHPMRNYLPDQLQNHLRYQSKVQERRPMRASLLMKERMKY